VAELNENFQKLEEKLLRAVEIFKRTQAEKHALQQEVESLRADFKERNRRSDNLECELQALRREREDVRGRIEKLLEQIDALTKPNSAG
jgi:chromosome segregation ATPase